MNLSDQPSGASTSRPAPVGSAGARLPWLLLLPLGVLLGLLCWRIWGLGPTHTDDAWWVARSYATAAQTVADWAHWQGRLWAYVSGTLIMFALKWQGTLFGELLRIGSFVLFFVVFHVAAAAWCGRRIALLGASLFLALFALKWDGSILHTYPLITWPAATLCALGLLAGRAYVQPTGRAWQLAAALLLQFVALFNNEGVTVACIALSLLAVAGNAAQGAPRARNLRLLAGLVVVTACYAALYLYWRAAHPTIYGGNTIAPFNAERIFTTLLHFSTSGTVLHSVFTPFSLAYAEPFAEGAWITWTVEAGLRDGLRAPLALLAGALSGWLVWRQLRPAPAPGALRPLAALLAGLALALLPIAPVALVVSYQDWVAQLSVRAYSHTVLAWFGWSLVLAALLAWLFERLTGQLRPAAQVLAAVLALGVAALAMASFQVNDNIAGMMRTEAGRWQVLDRAMAINDTLLKSRALWMPGLKSRTQYGGLLHPYWDLYSQARFGDRVEVSEPVPDINDVAAGMTMVDYVWDPQARRLVALAMAYRRPIGAAVQGGRIAVDLDGARPGDYLLVYRAGGSEQRLAPAALAQAPGRTGVFYLDPPADVDPASVRLLRSDAPPGAGPLCAIRLPQEVRVDLRRARVAGPALDPARVMVQGWHMPDKEWTWTGAKALLRIPAAVIPAEAKTLVLEAQSYTSAGFGPGVQRMRATLNGAPAGAWEFPYASDPPAIRMALPPRGAHEDLVLEMRTEPALADGLGLRVRRLTLEAR